MNLDLKNKNAIVCGSTQGIGEASAIELAKLVVKEAVTALGMTDTAVNVDLMLVDDQIFVIEAACRVGGTCLPELVGLLGGFDIYEELVTLSVTGAADFRLRSNGQTAASGKLVITSTGGVVEHLDLCNPAEASLPAHLEDIVIGAIGAQ